jgi:energy-coupling factor transport system permease protein
MSENFELLRNVTIGQYIPTGSVIHRLDPRAKITAMILIMVAFIITNTVGYSLLLTGLVLVIAFLSRIPIVYLLRGLLPALPVIAFLLVFQLIFRGRADQQGTVIFEWWFFRVTDNVLGLIAVGAIRVISFIFLSSLLTLTTTTSHLTHGVESLLGPFRRIGFPAHEVALTLAIAFRFVPTLVEELDRVAKAQASRLGNIGETSRWRPDKTLKARMPLIIPLFLNALRRGEELILAMEARCYVSGAQRTKLMHFTLQPLDYAAISLALALAGIMWFIGSRVG